MRHKMLLLTIALGCLALLASGGGITSPALGIDTTVGQWSFDEGSGTTVHDSSSYGNDGVAYNAEWVTGVSGYALHFDGTDASYVEVPDAPELTPSRHLVIDVWVNPDAYPATYTHDAIVYKGDMQQTGTGCFGERSYTLWLGNQGYLDFTSTPEGETCQHAYSTATGFVALNQWSHIVVDLDTWQGKVQIFVNDQVALEDIYPQKPIKVGDSPLRIGGMFRSSENQFNFPGSIDQVNIQSGATPAVGGIAEPPEAAVSRTHSHGTSLPVLALATAVGLLALAFAAGGWYMARLTRNKRPGWRC